MLFKTFKGKENSYFNVCVRMSKRPLFYYLHILLVLLIIANDVCICKSKQSNKTSFFEELKVNRNFTNIHRSNRISNKDLYTRSLMSLYWTVGIFTTSENGKNMS